MPPGEEKLTIKAEAKGFDTAAKDVRGLAVETDKLTDGLKKSVPKAAGAAKGTEKLTASTSDYTEVLRAVSPALGAFVDGAIKASKIAGDLATADLKLVGVGKKLFTSLKANSAALKLLGAGGAVVGGIIAIMETATEK